ncbi:MAG: site-2 protease family protein [Phycisphaerales bacterium]
MISTFFDFLLVVAGFSLIILLHELGHFLAARWAGIRVLAFAMGFGPAIVSYRKGIGVRAGSSEREYLKRRQVEREGLQRHDPHALSPTEYRWNIFPFGGYVKMLGQDDADPSARSDEADSFQNCPPWKRMIVISAGVIMNVITAAVLFLIVFGVGLKAESPKVGMVLPGSPASSAVASNAAALGITQIGLQSGDTILSIDGDPMAKFQDITAATIMSAKGRKLAIDVQRPGVAGTLHFNIEPRVDPVANTLALGIGSAVTGQLHAGKNDEQRKTIEKAAATLGFPTLKSGMVLSHVPGVTSGTPTLYDAEQALNFADGKPITVDFRDPAGGAVAVELMPEPLFERQRFEQSPLKSQVVVEHLAGLVPVLRVAWVLDEAKAASGAGLKTGDVFARLGELEWPSIAEGVDEIGRYTGSSIPVVVARRSSEEWTLVDLGTLPVNKQGKVGFRPDDCITEGAFVSRWPERWTAISGDGATPASPSGAGLHLAPGTQILAVNGEPVSSLADVRARLRSLAGKASGPLTVQLTVKLPLATADVTETVKWTMPEAETAQITKLGWESPLDASLFQPDQTLLKADGPVQAISMGLRETKKAMVQTYLTLARLAQGTVKVEHLKGPVGIAHVGTLLAERGFPWLLFFMAAISINLAVINFLPLPIVDGGQFLFILYEQITGKAVSVAVQNVAALAGLALIGCMFLIVTYNDVANLLWR